MTKSSKSVFNIAGVFRALGYSMAGLKAALVHERAFRQEAILFLVLAPLGAWLGDSWIDKTLLVAVLFVVLIVELLNSAIEAVVDRISTEQNELSGRAKDIGSAAVFLSITLVVLVWSWILIPPLL